MSYPKKNDENLTPFGTLEKTNNICSSDRWRPYSVQSYESLLRRGLLTSMPYELRKNITYSLQYLEYLELQLKELTLHSVICTMIYKSYIVIGVSIIEGIFHFILKSNNLWNKREWDLDNTIKSNEFIKDGENYRLETIIYKKILPVDGEMTFDKMIKKMESKKLLVLNHKAYPYIKKLRKLRNKIHLQINEYPDDTDWNSFNYIDYLWLKYTLYKVLTDKALDNTEGKVLEFIKLNTEEIKALKEDINKK